MSWAAQVNPTLMAIDQCQSGASGIWYQLISEIHGLYTLRLWVDTEISHHLNEERTQSCTRCPSSRPGTGTYCHTRSGKQIVSEKDRQSGTCLPGVVPQAGVHQAKWEMRGSAWCDLDVILMTETWPTVRRTNRILAYRWAQAEMHLNTHLLKPLSQTKEVGEIYDYWQLSSPIKLS